MSTCPICKGEGWVCENHRYFVWGSHTCCGGAGMPCECNKHADLPPGTRIIFKSDDAQHTGSDA